MKNRYELAVEKRISSLEDLKAFARKILLDEGYNIDIVDISEEGVKINSFKKLVKAIYNLGFKEGIEERALAIGTREQLERTGEMMTKHQRNAKFMEKLNQEKRY